MDKILLYFCDCLKCKHCLVIYFIENSTVSYELVAAVMEDLTALNFQLVSFLLLFLSSVMKILTSKKTVWA
jgi:hypothetical protein